MATIADQANTLNNPQSPEGIEAWCDAISFADAMNMPRPWLEGQPLEVYERWAQAEHDTYLQACPTLADKLRWVAELKAAAIGISIQHAAPDFEVTMSRWGTPTDIIRHGSRYIALGAFLSELAEVLQAIDEGLYPQAAAKLIAAERRTKALIG